MPWEATAKAQANPQAPTPLPSTSIITSSAICGPECVRMPHPRGVSLPIGRTSSLLRYIKAGLSFTSLASPLSSQQKTPLPFLLLPLLPLPLTAVLRRRPLDRLPEPACPSRKPSIYQVYHSTFLSSSHRIVRRPADQVCPSISFCQTRLHLKKSCPSIGRISSPQLWTVPSTPA